MAIVSKITLTEKPYPYIQLYCHNLLGDEKEMSFWDIEPYDWFRRRGFFPGGLAKGWGPSSFDDLLNSRREREHS
ncbi:MAG: hypothetical protein WA941_02090 [Nitrososphaeraceae archaeon]